MLYLSFRWGSLGLYWVAIMSRGTKKTLKTTALEPGFLNWGHGRFAEGLQGCQRNIVETETS